MDQKWKNIFNRLKTEQLFGWFKKLLRSYWMDLRWSNIWMYWNQNDNSNKIKIGDKHGLKIENMNGVRTFE